MKISLSQIILLVILLIANILYLTYDIYNLVIGDYSNLSVVISHIVFTSLAILLVIVCIYKICKNINDKFEKLEKDNITLVRENTFNKILLNDNEEYDNE